MTKGVFQYPLNGERGEYEKVKMRRGFYILVWNWPLNEVIKSIYICEKNLANIILDPLHPYNIYALVNKKKARVYSINFLNDQRNKLYSSQVKKLDYLDITTDG